MPSPDASVHRRLRVSDANSEDTEDRNVFSSLTSLGQVNRWIKAGRSDDFVKKALKLDILSEEGMMASPKYKYYVKFWLKKDPDRIKEWLKEGESGLPTRRAWERLGLQTMDPAKRENSAEYRAYMRYIKMYEDRVDQRLKKWFQAGDSAMDQRLEKWLQAGESDDFVMKALGLDRLSERAMYTDPNYKYYVEFWLKKDPNRIKEWLNYFGESGLPTHGAWERLGLRTMDPAKLEKSTEYRAYMQYAQMYDDKMFEAVSKDRHGAHRVVIGPYPEETSALVRLWVAENRPAWYVEKVLGFLRGAPDGHRGGHYFHEYANLMRKKTGTRLRA